MSGRKKRCQSLLFNYETSGRTDFRDGAIKPIITTVYKSKPRCPRPKAKPIKDTHAMTDWRAPNIPFDLYHKPKEIVRTHPKNIQKVFEKPVDNEKFQVQKSRPSLIMTPAVSMDDIDDPQARDILTKDMYTSEMSQRMREAVSGLSTVQAPFPGLPASANPIVLPKHQPPVVPPEWRMETVTWDNKQLRTYCDPTKAFWLARDPPDYVPTMLLTHRCFHKDIHVNQETT